MLHFLYISGYMNVDFVHCFYFSFLLSLIIDELKQILESYGLITIKDNNIKFVIDTSGRGGNYSWSMCLLENSLLSKYFTKMSVTMFNKYQKKDVLLILLYFPSSHLLAS